MDFVLKPVLWNTEGYLRPSGVRANSGYPKENGFGHEEWNNSDRLGFEDDGTAYRAFHTEGIGRLADNEAPITVFMYASHDGVQELVGVAGNAVPLMGGGKSQQRTGLAKRLKVDEFAKDAWDVAAVQQCFNGNYAKFLKAWQDGEGSGWIPNWFAPADEFIWLDPPVPLDPLQITGKAKLLTMFSRHTELSPTQAAIVMRHIPAERRNASWRRIYSAIQMSEPAALDAELQEIWDRDDIAQTTKDALVKSRLGQGRFRAALEQRWKGSCAVTGCAVREVLRASHIKRWADSNDSERLDPCNGLLLIANLDCLFDRGIISFSDQGKMLLSEKLSASDREVLQVPADLRKPLTAKEAEYMTDHRATYGFVNEE